MTLTFLDRLSELRGEMNTSQFSRFLGINQKSLDNYSKGQRKPSVELITTICTKCSVSADWLLGIKNDQTQEASDAQTDWKQRAKDAERKLAVLKSAFRKITEVTKELEGAI